MPPRLGPRAGIHLAQALLAVNQAAPTEKATLPCRQAGQAATHKHS